MTASNSDTWIAARPGTEQYLALGVANVMISKGLNRVAPGALAKTVSGYTPEKVAEMTDVPAETIEKIARDFSALKSLAIGGGAANSASNATETMVAVNILNYLAGNVGGTVDFSDPLSVSNSDGFSDMKKLVEGDEVGQSGDAHSPRRKPRVHASGRAQGGRGREERAVRRESLVLLSTRPPSLPISCFPKALSLKAGATTARKKASRESYSPS